MNILVDDINVITKQRIKEDFNTDFRIGILFELLMQDNELNNESKIMQAVNLFYSNPNQIQDIQKAVENILWFYRCGKEEKASQSNKENNQIYSYEFDDELIYSAFRDQYGINLQTISYLHWWEFQAMFKGLKEDNKIVEIMGYRAMDLGKIKDKEEKARYKKLKKIYALPDMRTPEQKEADFGRAFW